MLAAAALAFASAVLGAEMYRRWAIQRALDVPNARSSHTRPIPRGGGIAIVAGFLIGLGAWLFPGETLSIRATGWLVGALLVAAVSFVDDLRSLPALPRLAAHGAGALLLT